MSWRGYVVLVIVAAAVISWQPIYNHFYWQHVNRQLDKLDAQVAINVEKLSQETVASQFHLIEMEKGPDEEEWARLSYQCIELSKGTKAAREALSIWVDRKTVDRKACAELEKSTGAK